MRGLCGGVDVDLVHKQVRLVSQSGSLPHISSKDLAQLSKMLLHICHSILQLSGLSVPRGKGDIKKKKRFSLSDETTSMITG